MYRQSFTFLLIDSLPPAIFVPHVSYSRDSPIQTRYMAVPGGESSNFRGSRMCRGPTFVGRVTKRTLTYSLVDSDEYPAIQRYDERLSRELAIYLCENGRYAWDTRGNRSSCWDKQQVVEKSGFPLMALLEVLLDTIQLYSKRERKRERSKSVLCAQL